MEPLSSRREFLKQSASVGLATVPFGQGVTDFDGFLSHLMGKGYQGYLVVEQAWSEPKGDWVNDLKAAYRRFRKWES